MTTTGYSNFKINGAAIQTLGWNIDSISGLDGMPGRRGDNLSTPYQDGDFSFANKFYESRSFFMNMLVFPQDINGAVNSVDGGMFNLRDNLDYLKGLFNQNDGLQTFSFEVRDGVSSFNVREIDVEFMTPFNIQEDQKTGIRFTVEMVAARPLWRDLPMVTVNENAITGMTPYDFNIDTLGNAPIGDLVYTLEAQGAASTPALLCVSTGDKITINDPSMVLDDLYVINIGNKSFTKNGVRADSFIQRESAWFMRLPPSASLAMQFTAASGTYDLTLEYYKKWL